MKEFTKDAFLGGRIQVLQPKVGFRSSMEAVFLAASDARNEKSRPF